MINVSEILLKRTNVISTGVPTCRDEAEKTVKQIPRLPLDKLGVARNDSFGLSRVARNDVFFLTRSLGMTIGHFKEI
jgi:hypothetical protein